MRGGEGEAAVGGRDGLSNDAVRRGEVRTGGFSGGSGGGTDFNASGA